MRGRCIGWVLGIGLLACVFVLAGAPRDTLADDEPPGKGTRSLFVPLPEAQRPPGYEDLVARWRAKPRTESLEIGNLDESVLSATRGPLTFQVRLFEREWIQAPLDRRRAGVRRVRAFSTPRRLRGDRATLTIVEGTTEAPPKALLTAHREGRRLEIRWTGVTDVGGRMMYAARLLASLPNRPDDARMQERRWPRPDPWRRCAWRDDGSCFDVLVGYTKQVLEDAEGDPDSILADVSQSVIKTEEVFANSHLLTSIRIVGVLPTDISEKDAAGNSRTLDELLDLATDHQGLKVARYCLRADFATLLLDSGVGWGKAHIWRDPALNFAPRAYSVIVRMDAVYSYAMAHEMGHNMGCAHDTQTTNNAGLYVYSHGHQWDDASKGWSVGTVMSYANESLAIYSTPNETYPLGDASGTPVGHPLRSHNVRTVRTNRVRIANWGNQLARPW